MKLKGKLAVEDIYTNRFLPSVFVKREAESESPGRPSGSTFRGKMIFAGRIDLRLRPFMSP